MQAISGKQMHEVDRRTMEEYGIPGEILMENAGSAAASALMEWLANGMGKHTAVILAGKGNNGGDAFVMARRLFEQNVAVRLFCPYAESEFSGDTQTMYQKLPLPLRNTISTVLTPRDLTGTTVVVDGMLGTGFHGALREPFRLWCRLVNGSGVPVAAIDIPSGLDADTGEADPDAITADLTITLAAPKTGMLSSDGTRICGRLKTVEIGIPDKYINLQKGAIECTSGKDARSWLKREAFDIHKNSRGHLFIVGGSAYYPGAPLLASDAALHTGAGLVTCLIPENATIYAAVPKALILRRLPSENGFFSAASVPLFEDMLKKADALVIGPGMSDRPEGERILQAALQQEIPLLLDADALNLLSISSEARKLLSIRKAPTVLTPHPGEARRLAAALTIPMEQRTRAEQAAALAKEYHSVVVLKGARSITAAQDGRYAVNLSGCPALATAGSGDLLSGIVGAMLMNKDLTPFEAVRLAVYVHGRTAEEMAPIGFRGWIADDLPEYIGKTLTGIRINA